MNYLEQQKTSRNYWIEIEKVKFHIHDDGTETETGSVSFPNGAHFTLLKESLGDILPWLLEEMRSLYERYPQTVETVNDFYGIDEMYKLGKVLASKLGYPGKQTFWTVSYVRNYID